MNLWALRLAIAASYFHELSDAVGCGLVHTVLARHLPRHITHQTPAIGPMFGGSEC